MMRLVDFIDQDYLNVIKNEMINSKIFIPELIRSFLTLDEVKASFDESLRDRYGREKRQLLDNMSGIYIAIDLLNFFNEYDYWGLIKDKSSFLDFLKEIIQDDFDANFYKFSPEHKRKYEKDYNVFLNLYKEAYST